ncbi:MAG: molybdate ABC transporter substrate-binding protein [Telluria sp.]
MKLKQWTRVLAATALLASAGPALAADLVVSAASSLTNAFKDIAQAYEAQYPGSKISFNFGASGALLQQLAKGAPVDVFAAADQESMDLAQRKGLVRPADRRDFARNTLVVVVPAATTRTIGQLAHLAGPNITRIAIGNPASVPAGRYARHALEGARLWPAIQPKAITTQNVRQSLDYVARGEVDAGFVFATDAAIMKDKVRLAFEVPLDTPIRYPAAALAGGANAAEARRFVGYLMSPAGQAILARHGFRKP